MLAAQPLDTTVEVETPEHVRFRHQVVGPSRRMWAYLIDLAVKFLIGGIVAIPLSGISAIGEFGRGVSAGGWALLAFGLEWGYFTLFEALWSGRTPGKRFLNLRVVRDTGHPIDGTAAVLRNLLRAADFLPFLYALGLLAMSQDRRFRRLGDLAAGTMVVVEERKRMATTYALNPPPSSEEMAWLSARPTLDMDEIQTIDLLLRRSVRLPYGRVTELADMLAPLFAKRLGVSYHDPIRFLALLHHRATRAQGVGVRR